MFRNRYYQLHLDVLISLISCLKLERFTEDRRNERLIGLTNFPEHDEALRIFKDINAMLSLPLYTRSMEELLKTFHIKQVTQYPPGSQLSFRAPGSIGKLSY